MVISGEVSSRAQLQAHQRMGNHSGYNPARIMVWQQIKKGCDCKHDRRHSPNDMTIKMKLFSNNLSDKKQNPDTAYC